MRWCEFPTLLFSSFPKHQPLPTCRPGTFVKERLEHTCIRWFLLDSFYLSTALAAVFVLLLILWPSGFLSHGRPFLFSFQMARKRKIAADSSRRPMKKRNGVTAGIGRGAEAESNAVSYGRTDDNQDVSSMFPHLIALAPTSFALHLLFEFQAPTSTTEYIGLLTSWLDG